MNNAKNTKNCKSKKIICLFFVLIITLVFNAFSTTYEPFWIDINQTYRTPFNISLASSDLTNVTLTLNINQSFMGDNFNFTTHRNSLRIYYYNGSNYTNAPHYATDWSTINNNGTLQFLAPEISSTSQSKYFIYYGSSSYSNIENECSTYIYCDFFDDASINSKLSTVDRDTVSGTSFSESGGVLSITAGGADTWTSSDEYGSIYLNSISGDIDVRLSVISQTNPNPWCKAGIMIKNDMTLAGSSTGYSFNVRTPGNGYSFQRDENNNGFLESNTNAGSPSIVPSHVRIVKNGNVHSGYYSKTDQNSWTLINTRTVTSTNTIQDVGISLTSHAGSTTATATFDNFTIRRYHTDSFSFTNGSEETLVNFLNASITSPPIASIPLIQQNSTLTINTSIFCNSYSGEKCHNVSAIIQFNNTPTTFTNISQISGTSPMWTNTNLKSCNLNASQSCNLSFIINMTGFENTFHKIRIIYYSNDSSIENITSETLISRIVVGNTVGFNMSFFNYSNITKYLGNKNQNFQVTSNYGDNTNIQVECESGDCSEFSDTFLDGINLLEGNSNTFSIACLDNNIGTHTATFNVSSNEFNLGSYLDLTCRVDPLYGPLSSILNEPTTNINIFQNQTFIFNATASCIGICGEITGYLAYDIDDWYNTTYNFRQKINITTTINTQENYQVLLRLNSSNIGNNFNWSNNCNDLLFTNNNISLNYWVQNCSTSNQILDVWVRTHNNITTSNDYEITMYYGNPSASSKSNPSNTFKEDEIFLITGNCPSTSGFCNMMDNHADSDGIKANIGLGSYTIDGQGYVSQISHPNNPYGGDDDYYSRYRFLFIPQTSGDYWFGTASDDGSDAGIFPLDGYGGGIRTSHPHGQHDVVTDWYGGHGSGTCGSSPAIERSRTLTANTGYWIDYTQQERGGGQDSEMCIRLGSSGGYSIVNTVNFQGEIFSREYTTPEPTVTSLLPEESLYVSDNINNTILYSLTPQPQTCNIPEGGSCSLEWEVNATGPINSSYDLKIIFSSNYSQINNNETLTRTVNIIDTTIPEITLLHPTNNKKIISNNSIELKWNISDDDTTINASLYINNIYNQTILCTTNTNCTIELNITSGNYNWHISVNDSDSNIVNSTKFNFTIIKNYWSKISKEIKSINSDMYLSKINISNNLNFTNTLIPIDFVSNKFNSGSFTPLFNLSNSTTGNYNGTWYNWNIIITKNSNRIINYSITKNSNDYFLSKEYIIGLE